MMSEATARERLKMLQQNLEGWREPDGHLVATEPDPDERAAIRAELKVAIAELERVLASPPLVRVPYVRG